MELELTLFFERLAIDVLRQCDVSGATRILRISWEEAWGLMQRAVTRGRARKAARVVRRIGVDEKAAAKGHTYLRLGCDWDEGTVEYLAEARTQESLDGYSAGLSPTQLDGIEAVAMDMWEPYIQATRAHVPERRREEFNALRRQALKVGRAWAIKEALRCLWHYGYPASGWKFWKRWYFWATHSRLEPIRKAAETVRRHIENILTYYQHPVTNAMSEGLNSQIQKIKSMACGFRNIENFKTAIYFHCGGLDLYPC